MRAMLVFRQLIGLLDRKLVEATRHEDLTPEDVLLFVWMEEEPGLSGSTLSRMLGRSRQNIQASLERLLKRGLVVKYPACHRDRAVGWGMTEKGSARWDALQKRLRAQDALLKNYGVTDSVILGFQELIIKLRRLSRPISNSGLFEVPEEVKTAAWDL